MKLCKKLLIFIMTVMLVTNLSACSNKNNYKTTINDKGMAVYENQDDAFRDAKKDYKKLFDLTQKQFNLDPIDENNWEEYSEKIWDIETNDQEILDQIHQAAVFFDIYKAK